MAILFSWGLCFIFTVTNVFPPEKDKYGYYARTDARQGILAAAPWFKVPYPCKSLSVWGGGGGERSDRMVCYVSYPWSYVYALSDHFGLCEVISLLAKKCQPLKQK